MSSPDERIAVLVELLKDDDLLEAANRSLRGDNPTPFMEKYSSKRADIPFKIDTRYGAVAIGNGDGAPAASLDELRPKNSKRFLVRAFVNPDDIPERLDGGLVHSDPTIGGSLTCGNDLAVGDTAQVKANLRVEELWNAGYDGSRVAIAIVDTGIHLNRIIKLLGELTPGTVPAYDVANSWTPSTVATEAFRHRVGHGTMCAYDALIAAPRATLLDIAMLLGTPGGHDVQLTVFAAMHAFAVLANKWNDWLGMGDAKPYDALVISNSWGTFHPDLENTRGTSFIRDPKHPFRLHYVKPMSDAGVDIVFASNNCGPECAAATCLGKTDRMIMGANAYEEVLTVGGCDNNRDRVGYSSKGPSIPGMFQHKPDITSYTHFLGSKTRRIWAPDAGVSAACPVAAGCVAALRTGRPPSTMPPKKLFEILRSTASTGNGSCTPGGTWNPEYGCGIIDPVHAARCLDLTV